MTPKEQIDRQKLLTRCRSTLLNNGICTPDDADKLGRAGLLKLHNLGPRSVQFILDTIDYEDKNTLDELFPYPNGLDDARFALTDDAPPVREFSSEDIPSPPVITTEFLVIALAGLETHGAMWARGYLAALIDSADNVAGLSERWLENVRLDQSPAARDNLAASVERTLDTVFGPHGPLASTADLGRC